MWEMSSWSRICEGILCCRQVTGGGERGVACHTLRRDHVGGSEPTWSRWRGLRSFHGRLRGVVRPRNLAIPTRVARMLVVKVSDGTPYRNPALPVIVKLLEVMSPRTMCRVCSVDSFEHFERKTSIVWPSVRRASDCSETMAGMIVMFGSALEGQHFLSTFAVDATSVDMFAKMGNVWEGGRGIRSTDSARGRAQSEYAAILD